MLWAVRWLGRWWWGYGKGNINQRVKTHFKKEKNMSYVTPSYKLKSRCLEKTGGDIAAAEELLTWLNSTEYSSNQDLAMACYTESVSKTKLALTWLMKGEEDSYTNNQVRDFLLGTEKANEEKEEKERSEWLDRMRSFPAEMEKAEQLAKQQNLADVGLILTKRFPNLSCDGITELAEELSKALSQSTETEQTQA